MLNMSHNHNIDWYQWSGNNEKISAPPLQPPTIHALKRSLLFNLMGMGNQALPPIILHVHAPRKKPMSVQRSSSRLYFWFMRLPRLFIPQYSRDRASRLAAPFRCDFTTIWKQLFCHYLKTNEISAVFTIFLTTF